MTLDTTAAITIIIARSVVCSGLPEATVVVDVLAKWLLLLLSSLLYSEVVLRLMMVGIILFSMSTYFVQMQ
jgi:hypothetical protein